MKLDFLHSGGAAPGSKAFSIWEPAVARPLDDARHVVRTGLVVAGLFFGALLLFAFLAPISGAAVAPGEVTTSGDRIVIQPPAGGVVTRVRVAEGQRVIAGQPLVELNGTRAGALLEQAQARRDALLARQARLIAQRDDSAAIAFPQALTARAGQPAAASAIATEQAIFRRHREIRAAERGMAAADSDAAVATRSGAQRQLALIRDELRVMRGLYEKGYARRTQVRALERAAAELETQTVTGGAGIAKARLEQARLGETQMAQVVTELGQIEAQLAQLGPSLRVTRYDASLSELRAPVAGRVSSLAAIGQGSVVGGGATLMQIVPDRRTLIVEARIRPQDIDDVRVGQVTKLRFTSVNPRTHGSVDGRVTALSPAPIAERSGQYFRAQIIVSDPDALAGEGVTLQPGLPVTATIETEARTLADYLLAPLGDAFARAFREN
ncbi:HlyD family type I secretion periplasmic adaptor subunit [Sphingomonas sp. Y38-1Y]|uniref:HlyD family type I secretion periplasmic adaptor subunit n=1 Tax=Sphingomonas sp. Y38-1Y TaxID=3078265 RepID=UPI0028EAC398|nr:HlyD family type I secretion periplasmic adaptor subunit [Sphingomonas sp. Y38-1Y]